MLLIPLQTLLKSKFILDRGWRKNVRLVRKKNIGVYFKAKNDFDSLAIELKSLTYWQCQPLLKLYGPFDQADRPGDYQEKSVLENRINLNRELKSRWFQFRFRSQKPGYYFATIENDRDNTQFECYLNIESPNEDAVVFENDKAVYWKDLRFSTNLLRVMKPLKDVKNVNEDKEFDDSGFYIRNLISPNNSDSIESEVSLLQLINIEGIITNLQNGKQVKPIQSFLKKHLEHFEFKIRIPVWNRHVYQSILNGSNISNLNSMQKGSIESLVDQEFISQSKKFIEELNLQFPGKTIELFDDVKYPMIRKPEEYQRYGNVLQILLSNFEQNKSKDIEPAILNQFLKRDFKSWSSAVKWIFENRSDQKAVYLKQVLERKLFSDWLSLIIPEESTLSYSLASSDLNLIDQCLWDLDKVTLINPNPSQLYILKNLYNLNDKEIFVDQVYQDYNGPARAEKLRWLMIKNFDENIQWSLGNWNQVAKKNFGVIRSKSLDLINRAIRTNNTGRISRDINPALELSSFPKTKKNTNSKILVVCSDLNHSSIISSAQYISEIEFI